MTLKTQVVDVNFSQGIDTRDDDYLITGNFENMVNVIRKKAGGIEKRNGFDPVTSGMTGIKKVFKSGNNLCVSDGTTIRRWNGLSWNDIGKTIPYSVEKQVTLPEFASVLGVSVTANGLLVWEAVPGNEYTNIVLNLYDLNSLILISSTYAEIVNASFQYSVLDISGKSVLTIVNQNTQGFRILFSDGITTRENRFTGKPYINFLKSACTDGTYLYLVYSTDGTTNVFTVMLNPFEDIFWPLGQYLTPIRSGSYVGNALTNIIPNFSSCICGTKLVMSDIAPSTTPAYTSTPIDLIQSDGHRVGVTIVDNSATFGEIYVNGNLCQRWTGTTFSITNLFTTDVIFQLRVVVGATEYKVYTSTNGKPNSIIYKSNSFTMQFYNDGYVDWGIKLLNAEAIVQTNYKFIHMPIVGPDSISMGTPSYISSSLPINITSSPRDLMVANGNSAILYQCYNNKKTTKVSIDTSANTVASELLTYAPLASKISNGNALFFDNTTKTLLVTKFSDLSLIGTVLFGKASGIFFTERIAPQDYYSFLAGNYVVAFKKDTINSRPVITISKISNQEIDVIELSSQAILTGGALTCVDGDSVREIGFFSSPYLVSSVYYTTGGSFGVGTYKYKAIFSYISDNGLLEESIPTDFGTVVSTTTTGSNVFTIGGVGITNKDKALVKTSLYRTEANGSVFYKVGELSGQGEYTFVDGISDATLLSGGYIYTTGGVLENSPVGSCYSLCATKNRVFTVLKENPTILVYSKEKLTGYQFEMSMLQYIDCNGGQFAGDISDVFAIDEKIIIAKDRYLLGIFGDGPNAAGGGQDFSIPQLITTDVGISDRNSSVIIPTGVMFKSKKGIYHLDRKLTVSYLGVLADAFNSSKVNAVSMLSDKNLVVFGFDTKLLIYDYMLNNWFTWEGVNALSCTVYNDSLYLATFTGGLIKQGTGYTDNGANILTSVETSWLEIGSVQGFQRVKRIMFLGHGYGASTSRIRIYTDYELGRYEDHSMVVTETGGESYQSNLHVAQQKGQTIKIKIDELSSSVKSSLTGMTFVIGLKKGVFKTSSSNRI